MDLPSSVSDSPLGKHSEYPTTYTPSLLSPIPRAESRQALGIAGQLPFSGVDVWNAYEMSWLDPRGKPRVALGRFAFPCDTPHLIESKSFKLYLNSFNQTRIGSEAELVRMLEGDLGRASGGSVQVEILPLDHPGGQVMRGFDGENIDAVDVEVGSYQLDPGFLQMDAGAMVSEVLCSDLLKSNCPVTGQPDWASLRVSYRGPRIDRGGLLKYLVSFREHRDFHENCVERIFLDISARCRPERLTVSAHYTRRGGLDINPHRSNCGEQAPQVRLPRQ